ncbi:hypothetical protein AQUCO_04300108v1 [Aquilegia coerulea]|uniref:Uncharacterized protein n=1 Tax=Aquilegia coerulea TaxID=218851 RepID=A0A2G5CNR4_AQUCA|nr:hypothetical protein AQUCO_04300108v1 [Aquilegia coerulea]
MINYPKRLIMMIKLHKMISGTSSRRMKSSTKGHFVVYSNDESRFVIPLDYLNKNIFKELFRMSEEEFGLPRNGPIMMMPCDAVVMEAMVSLIQRSSDS